MNSPFSGNTKWNQWWCGILGWHSRIHKFMSSMSLVEHDVGLVLSSYVVSALPCAWFMRRIGRIFQFGQMYQNSLIAD